MKKFILLLPTRLINCLIFIWVFSIYLGDGKDDFLGILFIAVLIFIIFFNIYAIFLCNIFSGFEKGLIYIVYVLLLIIPFVIVFFFFR